MADAGAALRLTLAATRDEVGRAMEEARVFLAAHGATDDETDDLCLAVDEVLANVVLHGYGEDASGAIRLELVMTNDGWLLEVRDDAPAFDPVGAAPPALGDDPDERGVGGLGMHLVRTLMDETSYERRGGENVLRLRRLRRDG